MLCLSRKKSEVVNIYDPNGAPIGSVCVTHIKGDKAGIGFDFPSDYVIMRAEVDPGVGYGKQANNLRKKGGAA